MPHRSPVTCVCNGLSAAVGFARNAEVEGPIEKTSLYPHGGILPPHGVFFYFHVHLSRCSSLDKNETRFDSPFPLHLCILFFFFNIDHDV